MASVRGRIRLNADIEEASLKISETSHITEVSKSDIEDEFDLVFTHARIPGGCFEMHVTPQDVPGYPGDNYFHFATECEVSPEIGEVLQEAMFSTHGMRISEMISELDQQLCGKLGPVRPAQAAKTARATEQFDAMEICKDVVGNTTKLGEENASNDAKSSCDSSIEGVRLSLDESAARTNTTRHQIRHDFQEVRDAGFRVGKPCGHDNAAEHSIVSISIRASKLGLSENTLLAWNLYSSDYVVLLIKYVTGRYAPFSELMNRSSNRTGMEFRLRKCTEYRPTPLEAELAFTDDKFTASNGEETPIPSLNQNSPDIGGKLSTFGVAESVERLLCESLMPLMRLRYSGKIPSWDEALALYSCMFSGFEPQSVSDDPPSSLAREQGETGNTSDVKQPVPAADHMSCRGPISLPLVAMQFAMHFLVKCTDYCMICHTKFREQFKALKPYVCENPLCLFQYMTLGLGPRVEQEIIDQQYLVDLLISFCFSNLSNIAVRPSRKPRPGDFPCGLALQVPHLNDAYCGIKVDGKQGRSFDPAATDNHSFGLLVNPIHVMVHFDNQDIRFTNVSQQKQYANLRVGEWVLIHTRLARIPSPKPDVDVLHHARIESKSESGMQLHFVSRHAWRAVVQHPGESVYEMYKPASGDARGDLVPLARSFDDIESPQKKAQALLLLLLAMPPVHDMRSYLLRGQNRVLTSWNGMAQGVVKLLRWIITSNRSYIMLLDNPDESSGSTVGPSGVRSKKQKIWGAEGWMQFKFAQGSPGMEAGFQQALSKVTLPHPTILAWHGSPMCNWHSIIRNGLDFNDVTNGRVHGDGVYFSRSFEQSIGFSKKDNWSRFWPNSALKVTEAISLNELVNSDATTVHDSCYVVTNLACIRPGYLFVRRADAAFECQHNATTSDPIANFKKIPEEYRNVKQFQQQVNREIAGPNHARLIIPEVAFVRNSAEDHGGDAATGQGNQEQVEDDDNTDPSDVAFLAADAADEPVVLKTAFTPGTLNCSKLKMLPHPSYATKAATTAIQREIKSLQQLQSTEPLHELGWYIDFDKMDNIYQWIVEFHSFDQNTLLAQHMFVLGFESIVAEIRFLGGFPFTPPFVRIIKPRFLPPGMGGGGHVTHGGAICMELLTNSGWSPANNLESVLLQIRMAITGTITMDGVLEDRPVQLSSPDSYGLREAVEAYIRHANFHHWEIPPEFKECFKDFF